MSGSWTIDLMWWVTAVELPALGGLFLMNRRDRREADTAIEENRRLFERGQAQLREALAAYKLEVAKNYASIEYLKDVEKRLVAHLSRIEHKLDAVQENASRKRAGGVR